MRVIRFGGKHPEKILEYRLIPLMISIVKIGDELSAAALTRGIGAPEERTDICKIGFHIQDIILFALCADPRKQVVFVIEIKMLHSDTNRTSPQAG